MKYAANRFNAFEHYQVDKYVTALGLSVSSRYRGRGVGKELLQARVPLCKALGIQLTANTFTSAAAVACARKVGFEENSRTT